MTEITHEACPLCGSPRIKKRFACKDCFATGELFDIYECEVCRFVFTQGVPDEAEIGRYYDSPTYVSHSDTDKGLINKIYHVVRGIMLRRKVNLVKRLTMLPSGRLLDYGAGTGYFARAMQGAGWSVTAIEKSDGARNLAKEQFGFDMLPEQALADAPDKSFDVVTLWHVMEHIQRLDAFWDEMYRVLDDTGVAVVAVPNCTSYDAECYGRFWAAYDVPRHLWHFSPSTMMQWAGKHGFIMERRYAMPFDGFYISMLSERYKGAKLATLQGLWNGFLGWIATCDKCAASSSVIYVFRKKR